MKNIGIVCEGPTDFILLKAVIDGITDEHNRYFLLQPESDLTGQYGNGWKGVWKWCRDHAAIKKVLMKSVAPQLDLLIIHMDGDVSRRERAVHCLCEERNCGYQGVQDPMQCDSMRAIRELCPICIPCEMHEPSAAGCMDHLESLIASWLMDDISETCIVIPCDSMEAWIVAAYDARIDAEDIADPWQTVIARKKAYHDIRIPGGKKRTAVFCEFAERVCENWDQVTRYCQSAKRFEQRITDALS